jgi:hypothetical protein
MHFEVVVQHLLMDYWSIVDWTWTWEFDLVFDLNWDYQHLDCKDFVVDYSSYFDRQMIVVTSY